VSGRGHRQLDILVGEKCVEVVNFFLRRDGPRFHRTDRIQHVEHLFDLRSVHGVVRDERGSRRAGRTLLASEPLCHTIYRNGLERLAGLLKLWICHLSAGLIAIDDFVVTREADTARGIPNHRLKE
jgi:hypothetical protein